MLVDVLALQILTIVTLWRYLWNLLSNPTGLNLRNMILHGLTPRAERTHAAILIHAACFLRFLRVTQVGEQER
uniref:DUF4209 domain-containing protein n=1 Tax=Thermorudis peleae TaxID=1382356 RepID=A0A831T979_9BACT